MAKFVGTDKSEWDFRATISVLRDIQRKTGKTISDLFEILTSGQFDVELVVVLAECLTKKQRESRGVLLETFIDSALTLESLGRFSDAFGAALAESINPDGGGETKQDGPFAHGSAAI